jgi:hypothetical protein
MGTTTPIFIRPDGRLSPVTEVGEVPRCPWCSAQADAEDTVCSACGATLAQRESIGDLVIPGVTDVAPGLQAAAGRPLRIPGASPSQGVAGATVIAAALAGGPIGLAALGGLGALAATEYGAAAPGSSGSDTDGVDGLGRPSEAALRMAEHLVEKPGASPSEQTAGEEDLG